jgi:hypothetical protein
MAYILTAGGIQHRGGDRCLINTRSNRLGGVHPTINACSTRTHGGFEKVTPGRIKPIGWRPKTRGGPCDVPLSAGQANWELRYNFGSGARLTPIVDDESRTQSLERWCSAKIPVTALLEFAFSVNARNVSFARSVSFRRSAEHQCQPSRPCLQRSHLCREYL